MHLLECTPYLSDSLSLAASFTVAGPIMTKESDGLLEVCVNVTNGNNITDARVAIQVFLSDETTESMCTT
jgi:hypothetical protein